MRTHLMAGTALVAATMLAAGGAAAQDKKMIKLLISVNGYYEAVVGGVLDEETKENGRDAGTDTSALDVKTDAEIHFNGRSTLDNGMKIHARVELEGQNHHNTDPVDEYFISVSGSFGQIKLGGSASAASTMLLGVSGSFATNVGESLSYDTGDWLEKEPGPDFVPAGWLPRLDQAGDAEKISYISPKFGGFQVGLTYSPNANNNDDNARVDASGGYHDVYEGAAVYSGKFGDVGFAVGAGMTAQQAGNDSTDKDRSDWLVGGRIDFGGGFRVSAVHKRITNDDKNSQGAITDAGVRFVTGSNQFSLTGSYAETEVSGATHQRVMGSYARALGPGVKVHLNLLHIQSEDNDANKETNGLVGISGIRVTF